MGPRFTPHHQICGPSLDPPEDERFDVCACRNDMEAGEDMCSDCWAERARAEAYYEDRDLSPSDMPGGADEGAGI